MRTLFTRYATDIMYKITLILSFCRKKLLCAFLLLVSAGSIMAQKTKIVQATQVCSGLEASQKPLVAVMPFKITASSTPREVGTGMTDVMMDAMLNSGCFQVVERDRLDDIMKEQGLGMSGAGDDNSFAQVGKLAGAQILVFGTITEFTEKESGGRAGGLGRIGNKIGIGGLSTTTSEVGYTLRFVNPSTGLLLGSQSFTKNKTAVGAAGGIWGRSGIGGGSFYKSKSMQQAIDESLRDAVAYMSQNKSAYVSAAATTSTNNNTNISNNISSNSSAGSNMNKSNCPLLAAAQKPKIMVIIPEEHVSGAGSHYDPARYNRIAIDINRYKPNDFSQYEAMSPTQAGETEISKKLLETGFRLVDENQFLKLKDDATLQDAFNNPADASKIAARYGADILIIGEAFSEYSHKQNNMSSCRARVDVKAVMAGSAEIIATNSFNASGLDATEVIAGKDAIAKASTQIANYVITQFCSKSDDIISGMSSQKSTGNNTNTVETEVRFNNVDYTTSATLTDIMKSVNGVESVEKLSFQNKVAKFRVVHSGDTDSFIQSLVKNSSNIKLDVQTVEDNAATINVQ